MFFFEIQFKYYLRNIYKNDKTWLLLLTIIQCYTTSICRRCAIVLNPRHVMNLAMPQEIYFMHFQEIGHRKLCSFIIQEEKIAYNNQYIQLFRNNKKKLFCLGNFQSDSNRGVSAKEVLVYINKESLRPFSLSPLEIIPLSVVYFYYILEVKMNFLDNNFEFTRPGGISQTFIHKQHF